MKSRIVCELPSVQRKARKVLSPIKLIEFCCRTSLSSTLPMLSSCTCWSVIWSMDKSRTSRNCKLPCWRACICLTHTWEMRLAILWNPFWWRTRRISSGTGESHLTNYVNKVTNLCFDLLGACYCWTVWARACWESMPNRASSPKYSRSLKHAASITEFIRLPSVQHRATLSTSWTITLAICTSTHRLPIDRTASTTTTLITNQTCQFQDN